MSQPAWGPKPPFTYMPRLDEHYAPAQDTSGLSASTGYLTMTSVLRLSASLDAPVLAQQSRHADCPAPVAQP